MSVTPPAGNSAGLRAESLTVLVDNRAGPGLVAEHGFSVWLEAQGQRILFDTGQGTALAANARALGVDVGRCDVVVLSHGHYDHAGALADVLRSAPGAHLYCHPASVRERYSVRDGHARYIGMPPAARAAVAELPADRLHWVERPVWLSEHIGLTGAIPRLTDYEDAGGPFFLDQFGSQEDPLADDMALWVRSESGLIICLGCGHAGVVNTVRYVRSLNDDAPVRAVIGGFHLGNASAERLARTAAELQSLNPHTVIPCHCTGETAVAQLRRSLGAKVVPGASGTIYRWSAPTAASL